MDTEFTRKELYDLVWSQPMRTVAATIGISDVALAKQCKKAGIPVPTRGYWARKQAGKPAQIALPPRFPGASDRVGGPPRNDYWGADWPERFKDVTIPSVPTFDEDMCSVEERSRKLVGQVRCGRKFEPAHPLVAKLLAHDEERRKEFAKQRHSLYAPKYDAGMARRRLLIINALFLTAARIGCRPLMNTSKYVEEPGGKRDLWITIGKAHVWFTIEPTKSKKGGQSERLCLIFGRERDRSNTDKSWEDREGSQLENQLTEILVQMLLSAEASYRHGLARHREWIIERKAEAEAEIKRRLEEAERKARELQQKSERQRIGRLLSQAKALDRANQIRTYVESARLRVAETATGQSEFEKWANWAQREADRIDPVKNGTIAAAIEEHLDTS
ncbi:MULTISPECIES: hypothetical protein [Bradyrhizobium]|uniref:hypothetical protein n=1 Tax=Bradyrhizobium TaxID=374 RepID=UPI000231D803|nr:hypothetical protein [Bradyrhizobium japonicum]KMJ95071.1 hypothetical protein CF64_34250 [Bradyrhizobium japonicum]MCS3986835.1 hypothetical protein [Bradyrhizobium japonicum]MCS4018347.1 hypothetical protein [Bradyrhizobium japonicum]MDH6178751.1 hypothetical protein [Bradyrhizobium japonicum]BAL13467.1 hypothetical protein BJ6T_82230 [Bradyrhizobium japonicum USDA 6]